MMKELTFADYDKRLRSCFMGKSRRHLGKSL